MNSISLISDGFADLPSVNYINFQDNKFKTIKAFQFGGIQTARTLISLTLNEISTTEPQAFQGWLIH